MIFYLLLRKIIELILDILTYFPILVQKVTKTPSTYNIKKMKKNF